MEHLAWVHSRGVTANGMGNRVFINALTQLYSDIQGKTCSNATPGEGAFSGGHCEWYGKPSFHLRTTHTCQMATIFL